MRGIRPIPETISREWLSKEQVYFLLLTPYSILFLAFRTVMGAALADDDALNGRSAYRTGFPFPLVDAELVLKMAAFVSPVKG